jgi:hypothetical protein
MHPGVEDRVVLSDDRGGPALGLGEPPGVGELEDEDKRAGRTEFFGGRPARLFDKPGERVRGSLGDHELAGIAPSLQPHGRGLEPDEPGTAAGEPEVAPDGQFGGRAVRVGVGALHRQGDEPVGDRSLADGQR